MKLNTTERNKKIVLLKEKLNYYEKKLSREMKWYRGVVHESAASEIKHSKVMVFKDLIANLKAEIENLEQLK